MIRMLATPLLGGMLALWLLHCLCTGTRLSPSSTYIVRLASHAPVSLYLGGVPGFPAVSPSAAINAARQRRRKIPRPDVTSLHARAYAQMLARNHRQVAADVGVPLASIIHNYVFSDNAFAARLTPAQASLLRNHPAVAHVMPDRVVKPATTYTPVFLNVSSVMWSDAGIGGAGTAGKGMIVAVIDTGIWPEHPSFSDAAMSAFTVPSHWQGVCNTTSDFPSSSCNKKIIGARYFIDGFIAAGGQLDSSRDWVSPRDNLGHGSWCASAAAGASNVPVTSFDISYGSASGMAPAAHIATYKALWYERGVGVTGLMSDVFAAVDQAVADGVDVISISLEGPYASYIDDLPLLNAAKVGVFTAAAAGNSGSPTFQNSLYASTLSNPAPFYLTVGASNTDRRYGVALRPTASALPAPTSGSAVTTATGSAVTVADDGGASFDQETPAVAKFSSRGPIVNPLLPAGLSNLTNDILKPDLIGPGVALWGAYKVDLPGAGETQRFVLLSGTSMATPHAAGMAALVMQAHPDWSPSQIKSAMMTTARVKTNRGRDVLDLKGGKASPWAAGAGLVQGERLLDPGLTFDVSYSEYVAFLAFQEPSAAVGDLFNGVKPAPGYNLNLPSIVASAPFSAYSVIKRVVKNVASVSSTYTVKVAQPLTARVKVFPRTLKLQPQASATFYVMFTSMRKRRLFQFGSLTWSDEHGHVVRCPIGHSIAHFNAKL